MIVSFRNQASQDIAEGVFTKAARRVLPIALWENAQSRILFLNRARKLSDLGIPGWHLEKLTGNRAGQYSLRINKQYRICFVWKPEGVTEVEIVDYH